MTGEQPIVALHSGEEVRFCADLSSGVLGEADPLTQTLYEWASDPTVTADENIGAVLMIDGDPAVALLSGLKQFLTQKEHYRPNSDDAAEVDTARRVLFHSVDLRTRQHAAA